MVTISLFPTKEALAAPRQLLTKVNFINSELSYLERFYQELHRFYLVCHEGNI